MEKRLYKSSTNRILTGVCGGIAEYFKIDPTIVRVIFFILAGAQFGMPLYILLAIILPYDYQVEAMKQSPFSQWKTKQQNQGHRKDVTPEEDNEKWDDF